MTVNTVNSISLMVNTLSNVSLIVKPVNNVGLMVNTVKNESLMVNTVNKSGLDSHVLTSVLIVEKTPPLSISHHYSSRLNSQTYIV